jgi:hypothetical protein
MAFVSFVHEISLHYVSEILSLIVLLGVKPNLEARVLCASLIERVTEQKLTRVGTDVEKATPQVNASKLLGKPQQPGAFSNIESSRALANNENNADETPREAVEYY